MMEVKHNDEALRHTNIMQFPRVMYHDSYQPKLVHTPEEYAQLEPGWRSSPDKSAAEYIVGPKRGRPPKAKEEEPKVEE
jgi:hypothetical protein